ncbi:hypothetical protein [Anoxybacillus sp. J5B_2022]|uniref:hypothetical protein n=1 Tax=Anoxybacillus sp. J5B_2022 TaxID=3003246 RepID=UPI0022861F55|nr:hypothetical protein [Anoxybacillus sp. J5B_2022]MCZ0756095.1 hypothetical protein [Anoxybacillus sp. J5B_2022]
MAERDRKNCFSGSFPERQEWLKKQCLGLKTEKMYQQLTVHLPRADEKNFLKRIDCLCMHVNAQTVLLAGVEKL